MWFRYFSSFGAGLVLLTAASPTQAFCRTASCELGEEGRVQQSLPPCERDEHNCVTEGKPLHWPSPCLYYAVQRDGSAKAGIDAETFQQTVQEAFDAWAAAECPSGGSPRFEAQFQGFVGCRRREAVCGGTEKNVNVMMFHDQDWPELASAIGLTTPAGGTESGTLVDADLEINSESYTFSLDASGAGEIRLLDVVAHEVGHFLGLSHSDAEGSLMSVGYESLQLSRELLTADDVAAICAAYPPGAALACSAPSAPVYDECQRNPGDPPLECKLATMTHDKSDGGCSIGGSPPSGSPIPLSALMLAWWGLRRRRRLIAQP
jgi:uncharacterized protein (TIGR03382 family)